MRKAVLIAAAACLFSALLGLGLAGALRTAGRAPAPDVRVYVPPEGERAAWAAREGYAALVPVAAPASGGWEAAYVPLVRAGGRRLLLLPPGLPGPLREALEPLEEPGTGLVDCSRLAFLPARLSVKEAGEELAGLARLLLKDGDPAAAGLGLYVAVR